VTRVALVLVFFRLALFCAKSPPGSPGSALRFDPDRSGFPLRFRILGSLPGRGMFGDAAGEEAEG